MPERAPFDIGLVREVLPGPLAAVARLRAVEVARAERELPGPRGGADALAPAEDRRALLRRRRADPTGELRQAARIELREDARPDLAAVADLGERAADAEKHADHLRRARRGDVQRRPAELVEAVDVRPQLCSGSAELRGRQALRRSDQSPLREEVPDGAAWRWRRRPHVLDSVAVCVCFAALVVGVRMHHLVLVGDRLEGRRVARRLGTADEPRDRP